MPNDSKPQLTLKTLSAEVDELRALIKPLEKEVLKLRARLGDAESRLATMEVSSPPELRRLTAEAVARAVAQDPYVQLEILADWAKAPGSQFQKGAVVRADHVPYIVDYVRHGLLVGIPENQDVQVAKLRAQAEARQEAARAQVGLAKAAAARAEAELARARTEAQNYDGGEEVLLPAMEGVG